MSVSPDPEVSFFWTTCHLLAFNRQNAQNALYPKRFEIGPYNGFIVDRNPYDGFIVDRNRNGHRNRTCVIDMGDHEISAFFNPQDGDARWVHPPRDGDMVRLRLYAPIL